MWFSRATLNRLFLLALPMVVSQGALALMSFADRFFLSRISPVHVAASLGGGVSFWVCLCFFNGIAAYGNALVAQYFGRRDMRSCPRVVTQGIMLAVVAMPLLLLLAWPMLSLFEWMGHAPELVALEKPYFLTFMSGGFFFLVKTVLASYFSGIARPRVVMIADLIGVFLNIPLSYVLIFGRLGLPELGIVGAALGTVIACILSIAIYLLFYFNPIHARRFHLRKSFVFMPGIMRRYLRLGLPSGFEVLIGMGTFNVFLLMFQSYGVAEGAAMAIVFNWDMLSFVPLMGLNIALMSMIGRTVGAGDMSRTNEVISAGFVMAVSYAGVMGLCFVVFRESLLRMFATPGMDFSPILAVGAPMMIGMATYVVADGLILVCSGVLRGAGDTRWLMVASVSIHILTLIVQVFVIRVWQLGSLVSWYVFVAMLITNALLYLWRVMGSRWRHPERLARVMLE
ncbi:MATE family efflux transporter [Congregibacter variabilis]|uniref:Multidrug-efflux transporter n=1 Tax=Congregibacter variabilis TaxID=3081200 RepID=A0ABZ0I5D6_9GAMM|nr:MATE family efflux transporter [Congregibacter sp. IMCC43200]